MNEEKIDRILLNQRSIMKNLILGYTETGKESFEYHGLLVSVEETEKILNPVEEQSLPEKTKDALEKKE